MHKHFPAICLAMFLVFGTKTALAADFVTGLEAENNNGEISLKWNAQPETEAVQYKIYYSFESILENDGLYDDYIETGSAMPEHTFPAPQGYDKIYFAVLGIDSAGKEIDYFVEEIEVDVSGGESLGNSLDYFDESFLNEEPAMEDDSFLLDENDGMPNGDFSFEDENGPAFMEYEPEFPEDELAEEDFDPDPAGDELTEYDPLLRAREPDEPEVAEPAALKPADAAEFEMETLFLPKRKTGEEGYPKANQNIPVYIPPSRTMVAQQTTLSLLSAKALSPTEVELKFSAPILVEPSRAPEAFAIRDMKGNKFQIYKLSIENDTALLETAVQTAGEVYEFAISEPAYSPHGLILDPMQRNALFNGHPSGRAPTEELATYPDNQPAAYGPSPLPEEAEKEPGPQTDALNESGVGALAIALSVLGGTAGWMTARRRIFG